jgi:hypothetical protein
MPAFLVIGKPVRAQIIENAYINFIGCALLLQMIKAFSAYEIGLHQCSGREFIDNRSCPGYQPESPQFRYTGNIHGVER